MSPPPSGIHALGFITRGLDPRGAYPIPIGTLMSTPGSTCRYIGSMTARSAMPSLVPFGSAACAFLVIFNTRFQAISPAIVASFQSGVLCTLPMKETFRWVVRPTAYAGLDELLVADADVNELTSEPRVLARSWL